MVVRDVIARRLGVRKSEANQRLSSASELLAEGLAKMNERKFVNANDAISWNGGISGGAKLLVKRAVRKIVRPYVEPLVAKQNLFNNAVCGTMVTIQDIATQLHNSDLETIDAIEELGAATQKAIVESNEELKHEISRLESQVGAFAIAKNEIDRFFEDIQLREKPFTEFDKRTTSQSGEDSIVMYILVMLGYDFTKVRYLDLGANHAIALSNTFMLYQHGARGVLVEANPDLIPELKMYRSEDIVINRCISPDGQGSLEFYVLSGDGLSTPIFGDAQATMKENPEIKIEKTITVDAISVNEIFREYFDEAPDVMNIDIEGTEIEILTNIDFSAFRPLIIIVETISYSTRLVVNEKRNDIIEVMTQAGYVEYAFTGINSIFIDAKKIEEAM